MEYLDFELEIDPGVGRDYLLSIVRSPAGEVRETMHFPFGQLALENQLLTLQNALLRSGGKHRQILSPEEQVVQNFGCSLFEALFSGEVRSCYAVSQREAFNQGKGLRLKLRIHDPALAALPWEFLYDPEQGEYVCLSSNTPVVRYIELPQSPQPLTVTLPLSILGMSPSPKDLASLDIEREKQRMEEAIKDLQAINLVKLTWLQDNTWQSLQRAMREGPWHILHFVGHGDFNAATDEGLIVLENEEGKAYSLRASHLARLLDGHRFLRLVVLNSCEGARGSKLDIFSSTAAILVRRGIPAVLAMQYEITDKAAIELSRAFYESLADGLPVDMAVCEARKAISVGVTNTLEWGTPVLYMRSPNGVLFDLVGERPKQSPQSELTPVVKPPEATLPPQIKPPVIPEPPGHMKQPVHWPFMPLGGHHMSKRLLLIGLVLLVIVATIAAGGAFLLFRPQNVGPSNNTSFTINANIQRQDAVTSKQLDSLHETLILTGNTESGSVCKSRDNGQLYSGIIDVFGSTSIYAEGFVFKCSGTYKGDKLSYIETVTSINFTISGGSTCQSELPFVYEHLEGTFSNQNTISGTFSSDAASVSCSTGGSINANAETGTWTGTLIQG